VTASSLHEQALCLLAVAIRSDQNRVEPDIELKERDADLRVTIMGVDVYGPTTGEVRSHSTDDIACWFIDTDYNGESFSVRHAYFTGNDQPYEKLKRALRAEIDEPAWSSLYSTISRPFPKPTGKRSRIPSRSSITTVMQLGDSSSTPAKTERRPMGGEIYPSGGQ
jgi:adenine-specific DNA-methyltransferase